MLEYVGLDVSKEETSYCVMDREGLVLAQGKAVSDPDALFELLRDVTRCPERIVLETGTLSSWLSSGLRGHGLPVTCICARQANAVMKLNPNKTDANDARMLADMARTGYYREVRVKSGLARRRRVLLKARAQLVKQRRDIDNTMRGLLASLGLKLPKGSGRLAERVAEAISGDAELTAVIGPLLEARAACDGAFKKLDDRLLRQVKAAPECRLLMSAPGVGPVTAMSFAATLDDPGRFANARAAGVYTGLTSRRYQSGEMDISGRISKQGDSLLRSALYEAANVLMTRVRKSHPIKAWALRLRKRKGAKKAKVALARKLAVILLAMWRSGEAFRWPEQQAAEA